MKFEEERRQLESDIHRLERELGKLQASLRRDAVDAALRAAGGMPTTAEDLVKSAKAIEAYLREGSQDAKEA